MKRTTVPYASIAFLIFFAATVTNAQNFRISGTVTFQGSAINKANVTEIDHNHRILNQTFSDPNGNFAMSVTGGKTSISVTADSMIRFTHKIGTQIKWDVQMKKKSTSQMADLLNGKGRSEESTEVIVGHMKGRTIPQYTWLQELDDTLFTICIPIRVSSSVEEYPDGRRLTFLDKDNQIMCQTINIATVAGIEGDPGAKDPYLQQQDGSSITAGTDGDNYSRGYYCYPRFIFSQHELEYLIDNSNAISRLAIDTATGDNYWMYYPSDNFAMELQKMVNKILR